MKDTQWTCDWCGNKAYNYSQPEGWVARDGKLPAKHVDFEKNEKRFIVHDAQRHFCTNKCNQSHKAAQENADEQARMAWLAEFNRHKA